MDTSTEVYANLNLTACPLGYVFQTPQTSQPIRGTCECADTVSDDVQCDFVLGAACIRHGYWFGEINAVEDTLNDTAPCEYPYCKTDLPPCLIIGLAQTYNQLPVVQDEQCNGLYGGLLCRSCREGAVFSFEAVIKMYSIIKLSTMATLCYFSTCSYISTCSGIWDRNRTKSKL